MPLSPSLRLTLLLFLLGFAGVAPAQTSAPVASPLEEVDPDAKPKAPPARAIAEEEEEEATEEEATEEEVEEEAVKRPAKPAAKAVKPAPVPAEPAAKPEVVNPRPAPTPLLAPRITDADLQNVWARWAKARRSLDWAGAQKAQQELITLADEIGAADLEPFSMGFLRAAEDRVEAGDLPQAL